MTYSEAQSQRAVNDILSSIRQIISEDTQEGAQNPSSLNSVPSSARDHDSKEEILDLTRLIKKDGSIVNLAQKNEEFMSGAVRVSDYFGKEADFSIKKSSTEHNKGEGKMAETGEAILREEQNFQKPKDSFTPDKTIAPDFTPQEKLLSEDALQESASAFAQLARATQKPAFQDKPFKIEAAGEYTVDNLMRELLRPLLREWLDAHLPSIIRTLVAEQIEKTLQQRHATRP